MSVSGIDWYRSIDTNSEESKEFDRRLDFACRVESLMEEHGVTETALAEKLGKPIKFIKKILTGDTPITTEGMEKIISTIKGTENAERANTGA